MTLERLQEIEAGWWVIETRTRAYSPRGLDHGSDATRDPSRDEADWSWVRAHATPREISGLAAAFDTCILPRVVALWRERAVGIVGPVYGAAPLCGEELAQLDAYDDQAETGDRGEGRAISRDLRRRVSALRARNRTEAARRETDAGLNET